MRHLCVKGLFGATIVSLALGWHPATAATSPGEMEKASRLAWWREARFGMFLHWGPVSLKGTEISWSRANTNPAHPNKGLIPAPEYDRLYERFNPSRFDAGAWAGLAREAGMRYMILTAKHCDGFCLWDSKIDDYRITRTPFGRDVCRELASAARDRGLRIGWYYSPMDWRDPDCRTDRNTAYVARMQEHLRELLSGYGRIDLLWFDTDGCPAPWDQGRTYWLVRELQPGIIINNRLDLGSMDDYDAMPIAPQADYYTPEQRVGSFDDQRPWETCMTLGTQWSWKPNDRIKSTADCVRVLARCAGGDGNLLLNVGPRPDGTIEHRQADVLRGIGRWLERHGESVYGTRGGPYLPHDALVSTRKGNVVYLHLLKPLAAELALPLLPAKILRAECLDGATVGVRTSDVTLHLTVAVGNDDVPVRVVKLTLDRPAAELKLIRGTPQERGPRP